MSRYIIWQKASRSERTAFLQTKKDPEGCIRSQECYHAYKYWCEENNCKPFGPRAFNSELRGPQRGHLLKDSATVDGKTVRNVIPGYSLKDSTG